MIVKIQRPIVSNEKILFALVYNENRSYMAKIALSDVMDLFVNNELKVYHEAEPSFKEGFVAAVDTHTKFVPEKGADKLIIGQRVEDQDW